MSDIKIVASVGSGLMGRQIALNSAKHGYMTYVWDRDDDAISKFNDWLTSYISGRVEKGKITSEEGEQWVSRLVQTTNLCFAVKDADLIIESVKEDIGIKRYMITECNKYMKPTCILGTNSSAIPSSVFADCMKDPSKLCNMHFFNPALVMELVEVVMGPHTSQETADIVLATAREMGKSPICMKKEIEGFIVSRMLDTLLKGAFELVEGGYCTPQELDIAMEKGCNFPMGPFRLMDLTGIDLEYETYYAKWQETKNPADKPPVCLEELYKKGYLGRKTGKGWYEYAE